MAAKIQDGCLMARKYTVSFINSMYIVVKLKIRRLGMLFECVEIVLFSKVICLSRFSIHPHLIGYYIVICLDKKTHT